MSTAASWRRSDDRNENPKEMPVEILQLCPFIPFLERALVERYKVHRWFEIADPAAFLDSIGPRIKGVATGGHIGLPPEIGAKLSGLEVVGVNGVGLDKVDLAEARRRGYAVSNTPDILTANVADLAVGL